MTIVVRDNWSNWRKWVTAVLKFFFPLVKLEHNNYGAKITVL